MKIAIFGAGTIGCFVGGCLAHAGAQVTLIGRERVINLIQSHGLIATDYQGRNNRIEPDRLVLATDARAAQGCDVVLITTKSAATIDAAEALRPYVAPTVPIVSFQNGIHNADILRQHMPSQYVLAGMVPFNVIDRGQGAFHQGSEGKLMIETGELPAGLEDTFEKAALPLNRPTNMKSIMWGKLLLNLNNPVNALSGVPLKEELSQRNFRRCVGLAIGEAVRVLKAAHIEPAKVTALPPKLLPLMMNTPDWLFALGAKKMLSIDPLARSSMWEDLELGRRTEIDWINGEVVKLAEQIGLRAPVNQKLVSLIRQAEMGGKRNWTGAALLEQLKTTA